MSKLLTGFCVLALGASVLAGCTERSDRVGGNDHDRTSPSASPSLRPVDPVAPTVPPPSSAMPPSSTSPSTDTGSGSSGSSTK
jgi:hypothetical protein